MLRSSLRPDAVLVQAVIAGALSFAHLHDLAEAAGQTGWKAWAYPVSVDLLLVAAWHRLRSLAGTDTSRGAAWAWFTIALAASLGANIATAGLLDLTDVPNWLRVTVAGWPALAFLGGTLLAHSPSPGTAPADEPQPSDSPADLPQPVREASDNPAELEQPHPLELVNPEPSTAPEPEKEQAPEPARELAPVPGVPPALLEHARKLADLHRTKTGHPMDADTLSARLGLPGPLAQSIAHQLA